MNKDEKKNKPGKPSFKITEAILKKAEKYAEDGLFEYQIAEKLKICSRTLIRKKKEHSQFCQAIKRGRDNADVKVENRLFKDACKSGNTTAQIFYLKNRCKERWGDQVNLNANINIELADALNAAIERKRKVAKSRADSKP